MSAPLEDYRALRTGRGAYRRARDLLRVAGPDAGGYLQGQCSQDLAALAVGAQVDSLVLTPEGKVTALVRVLRLAEDAYLLDTDAGAGPALAARLARFKLRAKLAIEPVEWQVVALRGEPVALRPTAGGPDAPPGSGALPDPDGAIVLPYEWNGWRGADLLYEGGAPEHPPPGYRWCDETAWEACRIEAGVPRTGAELDERTIPAEVPGLVERSVSFTKGCYTGQELVARLDARGNRVARRLVGVVVPDRVDRPGGATPGELVGASVLEPGTADGKELGRCTSAAWSPGLGGVVALAYLHRSVPVPAAVDLKAPGGGPPRAGEARPLPLA